MRILLSAQDGASSVINQFASDAKAGLAGLALAGIGVAAAIGVKAVQAAADFQSGLTLLSTQAGETEQNLNLVGSGIKGISVMTATSTQDLLKGMFLIESAGYHGAQGLQVLAAAAEGAKVGDADLGKVTDVLTTTLHDYNMTADQSTPVMNSLITTVKDGKMTMDDLNGALRNALPVASSYGIKLSDVEGALAKMAAAGDKGSAAGTHLQAMFTALANPTGKAAKEMQAMGLDSVKVAGQMKQSLPEALQTIQDAVAKHFKPGTVEYNRAIQDILGGAKSGRAGLELMSGGLKDLKGNASDAAKSLHTASGTVDGFSKVQQTFNFKMDQAKQAFNVLLITIGQQLLPILTKLVGAVAPIVIQFSNWIATGDHFKTVMYVVGAALLFFGIIIAAIVVPALWAMAAGMIAATWPIILIAAIITVVVVAIILAITHWGAIMNWLGGVVGAVGAWIHAAFENVKMFLMMVLKSIESFFINTWNGIKNGVQAAWNWIVNAVQAGINFVKGIITAGLNAVVSAFQWLYNHNYYFKALVDAIHSAITFIVDWLRVTWDSITHWIVTQWTHLKEMALVLFDEIKFAIQSKIEEASAILHSIWNSILSFLSGIWNSIVGQARSTTSSVVSAFQSIVGPVMGALGGLGSSIAGFFGGLMSQAFAWGANIVNGIANGIRSAVGAVAGAASSVAHSVASFLGFHSPAKEGPGKELDAWPRNLIASYAKGLKASMPVLQASLNTVMQPVAASLSGTSLQGGGGSHSVGPIVVNINAQTLDPATMDRVAQYTLDAFSNRMRAQYGNVSLV